MSRRRLVRRENWRAPAFWWKTALVLAPIFLVLFTAVFAWARAGGGEGYSGGDGGGGYGGGGGHGGGAFLIWLIFDWIRFCVAYPALGLPITVIFLAIVYMAQASGRTQYQGSVIRRGISAAPANRSASALATLKQADPNFDENAFEGRVALAFNKIQAAWSAQDLNPVRPFISDGVHERFSLQFDEQRALGYRGNMEQIRIAAIALAQVDAGPVYEVATVRIDASAVDYRVSLADGRFLSGSKVPTAFVEYWSFLRRRGTTSSNKPGLIESHCPNCGAALDMNQAAQCPYCKALLRSGQFDWVLVEITQASEWRSSDPNAAPGETELRQRDPSLSDEAIQDSASVMFWRKAMTDRIGSLDPLRKIATDDYCTLYETQMRQNLRPDGSRSFLGDCAVGSVRVIGFTGDAQRDHAIVEVRFSGTWFLAFPKNANGAAPPPRSTGQPALAHALFVLGRNAGVTSDPGAGVSSAHCPNCGAPMSNDASHACQFCGTVLNDGSKSWTLEQIAPAASDAGQAILRSLHADAPRQPADMNGVLPWLIRTAVADGTVDPRERGMLDNVAAQLHLPRQRLDQMIEMASRNALDVPDPRDRAQAAQWLSLMAAEALADGKIDPRELSLLRAVGARYGVDAGAVDQIIRQQRARVYSDAQEHLRQARGNNGN